MTMNLHDPVAGDGLFDILGKYWAVVESLNTAVGTTLPPVAQAAVDQFKLLSPSDASYEIAAAGLPASLTSWQGTASTLASQVRQNSQNLLREWCRHDAGAASMSLGAAVAYLIEAMQAADEYVTPNAVAATLTAGAANAGDSIVAYSLLRGDGRVQENTLAETVTLKVLQTTPAVRPSVSVAGQAPIGNLLAYNWPAGSGASKSITPTDAAASLLSNGDFEDADDNDLPAEWIVTTGVAGSTLWITDVQQQTIAIANTPGSGYWLLYYTDRSGVTWATAALPYNATGPQVQTALRAIPDLGQATVSTTGTTPNYTHTVTMTGTAGNPTILSSANFLGASYGYSAPTISHAITVPGDEYAFKGRALRLESDGAETTTLYHAFGVTPRQVYFVNCFLTHVGTSPGTIHIEVLDGIGGTVLDDEEGSALSLTLTEADLSATASAHWFAFRVPPAYTRVHLRVRISSAFAAGDRIYLDEMAITRGTQLYAGGPFVAMFAGRETHVYGDTWTLEVTNNRAGLVQEWFARMFNAAASEILLPSAGSNLIPNTVVSGAVS